MRKLPFLMLIISFTFLFISLSVAADIPMMMNYQGYVEDGSGLPLDGSCHFKFAIVDPNNTTFWSNDGTSINGNEPDNGVTISVTKGFFTIKLGNTALTNMSALPASVFTQQNIFVRVWFSNDYVTFEQLSPDTQIVSSGYAYKAQTLVDNTITSSIIQDGAITNADISGDTKIDSSKIDSIGLDADTLDGKDSSDFAVAGHMHNYADANHTHSTDDLTGTLSNNKLDPDLQDLADDGLLSATKVEHGMYFIDSPGTSGQVWKSDGTGKGVWATDNTASISEATVENYIANDVSSNYVPRSNGSKLLTGSIFDNGTKVGIGTDSPLWPVEIHGTIDVKNENNNPGDAYGILIHHKATNNIVGRRKYGLYIEQDGDFSGGDEQSFSHGINIQRVNGADQNIGLRISGIGNSASDPAGNVSYGLRIEDVQSNAGQSYAIYVDATDKSYFAGNIGIGTTSPSEVLEVAGNIKIASGSLKLPGSGQWTGTLQFGNSQSEKWISFPNVGKELSFEAIVQGAKFRWHDIDNVIVIKDCGYIGIGAHPWGMFDVGGGKFVVKDSGNVGIGTTDPGTDKLDVRGTAYASGGWQTTNADYAEWFEKEEDAEPGDIIGINLETGKVRKYRPGDRFIGIYSKNPAYVGNRINETDEGMAKTHILVGLLGQLDFNREQVIMRGRIVETSDGKEIGILLSNDKVLIGRQ